MSNKQKLWLTSSLLLLILFLGTGFLLIKSSQTPKDVRTRASVPSGSATLDFTTLPAISPFQIGQTFTTSINLAPIAPLRISAVQLHLSYPFTATQPELQIQDADPAATGVQIAGGDTPLTIVTNSVVVDQTAKVVSIDLAGYYNPTTYPLGYPVSGNTSLAKINFLAQSNTTGRTLSFGPTLTKVIRKTDAVDILSTPTATVTYIVTLDTTPPTCQITIPVNGTLQNTRTVSATFTGSDNRTIVSNLLYSWKLDRVGGISGAWSNYSNLAASSLTNLADGTYTLLAKTKDEAGNESAVASSTFTIDGTPPITSITSTVPGENQTINVPAATITFTGSDNRTPLSDLLFSWKLDTGSTLGSWSAYNSATTAVLTNLESGSYTFSVKAKDQSGNQGLSALRRFTVQLPLSKTLLLKFQNIDSQSRRTNKNVILTLKNTTFSQTVNFASGADGTYTGQVTFPPTITFGQYDILVRGPSHLQKKFAISLTSGVSAFNWTATPLLAGDITGEPDNTQDNIIDVSDLGLIISVFNPTGSVVAGTAADLNDDGKVDVSDLGLLISNFNPTGYGDF